MTGLAKINIYKSLGFKGAFLKILCLLFQDRYSTIGNTNKPVVALSTESDGINIINIEKNKDTKRKRLGLIFLLSKIIKITKGKMIEVITATANLIEANHNIRPMRVNCKKSIQRIVMKTILIIASIILFAILLITILC